MSESKPRAQRGEARRRRILEAARELFIENGFHATGIAAIAKRSEVAVAQLYRDFPSKEDIVAGIVEQDGRLITRPEELAEAIKAHDVQGVHVWIEKLLTQPLDSDHDRVFIEIVAEASRNPRIGTIFDDIQLELRKSLMAALESVTPAATPGAILQDVAALIMTLSVGLIHHRLLANSLASERATRASISVIKRRLEELAPIEQNEFSEFQRGNIPGP